MLHHPAFACLVWPDAPCHISFDAISPEDPLRGALLQVLINAGNDPEWKLQGLPAAPLLVLLGGGKASGQRRPAWSLSDINSQGGDSNTLFFLHMRLGQH